MNVGFISLGCSKNLVDTEMMIGIFKENKFNIVNDPKIADVIVINTCGFIESAKEEAINTILEMAEYKKTGKCKVLIATGCLVERYKEDLEKALPEVDIFLKYSDYAEEKGNSSVVFAKVLKEVYDKIESKKNVKLVDTDLNFMNRVITTGEKYSYIRIAEGCSNRCTYCAIPYIRGNFVSRKMEDIIEEAKQIVSTGRRELILIAQDTSKYGKDIYGKPKLAELLTELCKIKDLKWVRFLYTYPEDITDELIKVVKEKRTGAEKNFEMPKVCPVCGAQAVREEGEAATRCIGIECPAQLLRSIVHFVSKEAMDIDGLGYKIVEQLIEKGLIKNIADIYTLSLEDIASLKKNGKKFAGNLIDSIEKSKKQDLFHVINALGIRQVGIKAAKVLAKKYKTMEELSNASFESLALTDDVGEITANNIIEFFAQEQTKDIIKRLKDLGVNMESMQEENIDNRFEGKVFVLTGALSKYNRKEAEDLIEKYGGKTSSSVSKKTTYVLAGEDAGSKLTKAQELGVIILSEEEFEKTYEFIKKVGYTQLHVFPYSMRKGTPAARMVQVDEKIKHERVNRLIALSHELNENYAKSQIGKTLRVLFEKEENGYYVGHGDNYLLVKVPSDKQLIGQLKNVIIDSYDEILIGRVV